MKEVMDKPCLSRHYDRGGQPYTEESKMEAVAWTKYMQGLDWGVSHCARELGISNATLSKWLCDHRYQPKTKSLVSGNGVELCKGDRVKVLDARCISSPVYLNDNMKRHIGKEFTIGSVTTSGGVDVVYFKESEVCQWSWDTKWVEKVCHVEQPETNKVVYIEAGDRTSPLMDKFMKSYRRHGEGERVHVYNRNGQYRTYAKGINPRYWDRDQFLSYAKVDNILDCGVPYCEPKPEVCGAVTKEEWLVALIGGAIGGQSGNTSQRWRYNKDNGKFESKYMDGWRTANIAGLIPTGRTLSIIQECEMTVAEIECKLGITNLKVVK